MAEITVRQQPAGDGWTFQVRVSEGDSATLHQVTLSRESYLRLSGGAGDPATCVRRSFEFLLGREPKEAILSRFDLPLIGHYFPDYEQELAKRLAAAP